MVGKVEGKVIVVFASVKQGNDVPIFSNHVAYLPGA